MFVSRKEHEELKKKVEEQEKILHNLMHVVVELQREQKQEPTYFG